MRISRENLGESIHTAMRKCCDGKGSTISWNVIRMMKPENWKNFLDFIHAALKKADRKNKVAVLKEACLEFEYIGQHDLCILHTAFEIFTDREWDCLATWI